MDQQKKNKQFIIEYITAMSGQVKTRELLEKYNDDEGLIGNILFKENIFPRYEATILEIVAEGDRVVVLAKFKGIHKGEWLGIAPTHKEVTYTFAVGYEVRNNKIAHSWLVADNLSLVDQLKGVLQKP
ncbi:MAG: ester cyclase [Flammeovirgaceae bacterium]|nr:ester cyclase [Flammeovirgaceae bacterium]